MTQTKRRRRNEILCLETRLSIPASSMVSLLLLVGYLQYRTALDCNKGCYNAPETELSEKCVIEVEGDYANYLVTKENNPINNKLNTPLIGERRKFLVDINVIYRVSQKKQGLVFRCHFKGLDGLQQKS